MVQLLKSSVFGLTVLAIVGCGGNGGSSRTIALSSSSPIVGPGATATVRLTSKEFDDAEYRLVVVEGSAGGALSATGTADTDSGIERLYTAPTAQGTYQIRGTVVDRDGTERSKTIRIVVTGIVPTS